VLLQIGGIASQMRPAYAIVALLAVAVLVAAIEVLPGRGGPHPPETGEEKMAAAYALVFARGLQVGDAGIACGTARDEAARELGCGTARPRIRSCGPLDITDVKVDGTYAVVRIGDCTVELVPGGTRWVVAKLVRD